MTIRESEVEKIRWAFEEVKKGRSLRSLAIQLGVRALRVREALTHRSYIGEVKHLGEFMPSKLVVLKQNINTPMPDGRLFFTLVSAFAQFEAETISARTRDGIAAAKVMGRLGGRRPKLNPVQKA